MSPLKPERITGVDFVVVRELTGGIYFGDHIHEEKSARDINEIRYEEVEREDYTQGLRSCKEVGESCFSVSISKMFWQHQNYGGELLMKSQKIFPATLEHQLVDSAAMLMITNPAKFDIIVTENLFRESYLMNQAFYLVRMGYAISQPL